MNRHRDGNLKRKSYSQIKRNIHSYICIKINILELYWLGTVFLHKTVENGQMTKDLAILINKDQKWLNTQDFLKAINMNFKSI